MAASFFHFFDGGSDFDPLFDGGSSDPLFDLSSTTAAVAPTLSSTSLRRRQLRSSLRPLFDLSSTSLRPLFDLSSTSLRPLFDFSSAALRPLFDGTLPREPKRPEGAPKERRSTSGSTSGLPK
ncbi:MAG: hypothetical protein WC483_00595 [Candidatus Paceibacterota bacterium]